MVRYRIVALLLVLGIANFASAQVVPVEWAVTQGLNEWARRQLEPVPDPFPIRRVLLAPSAPLPATVEGDPFLRMSRAEFEQLVRAAARNKPATPRLLKADYQAILTDDSLAGTGEWIVSSDESGSLALDPLRMAWKNVKWSGDREARVSGTPARLWLDRPGRSALTFDWSVRGTEEPGAVRFVLQAPSAPLARLELELPSDRYLVAKAGTMIIGPIRVGPQRSKWQLAWGGETTLEFSVRLSSASRPASLAVFSRTGRCELTPGLATLTTEWEISPLRDAPQELVFDVSPGLAITDVTGTALASWRMNNQRLVVTFREPLNSGRIAITALASLPADGAPWSVPRILPMGGPLSNDQLELIIGNDLKWEGSDDGDYRALRATTNERGLTIAYRGTLLPEGRVLRESPRVRVRAATAKFSTRETLDWRIQANRTQLTARIRASVEQGPLTRLIVRLPADAKPFATVTSPDDPTATLSALGNGIWAIEPTQPVATGETLDLRLEFRGPTPHFQQPGDRADVILAPPSIIGAERREGTVAIQTESVLKAWLSDPVLTTEDVSPMTVNYSRDLELKLVIARQRIAQPDRPEPANPPNRNRWSFSQLKLNAALQPDGGQRVEFTGHIHSIESPDLPIRLPSQAKLLAVRLDGQWVDPKVMDDHYTLSVPVPGERGISFELVYTIPMVDGLFPVLNDLRPELPEDPPFGVSIQLAPEYRTWPALADATTGPMRLVPVWLLKILSCGFATLILGLFVMVLGREHGRRTLRFPIFLLVAVLGLANGLAPSGWSLVLLPSLIVLLCGYAWIAIRWQNSASVGLVMVSLTAGQAQAPAPVTVYFLAPADHETQPLIALVPQSVRDRLEKLIAPHVPEILLIDAEYRGEVTESHARFLANWRVEVTRDGSYDFELPLSGVKLEAMTLNDQPAFPDASRPGRYRITLARQGVHALKAAFTVPLVTNLGDREIRFGIPDHPTTRISLDLPESASVPDMVGRTGGWNRTAKGNLKHYESHLGLGTSVLIRWRGPDSTSPVITVKEATVWDVSETRSVANAAFLHRIERGTLDRLIFEIPANLEPGRIVVRELDTPGGSLNGLKDWSIEPNENGNRLVLVLRQPARGLIATMFQLDGTGGTVSRPTLAMPRTLTGDVSASYLGVRLSGVEALDWKNQNLIDITTDTVAREFSSIPELAFDRTLTRSLRREGPSPPIARPVLSVTSVPEATTQQLQWTLGSRAEVAETLSWTGASLAVVTCDIPPGVEVTNVEAENLAVWEVSGQRLRVWMMSELRDPTIRWIGHWPAYSASQPFELPGVPNATIRVKPQDGAVLTLLNPQQAKVQTTSRSRELQYPFSSNPNPLPRFQIALPTNPQVFQKESVILDGNTIEHRVELDVALQPNRPHMFTLQLDQIPIGAETRIVWPEGATGQEIVSTGTQKKWWTEREPRADGNARWTIITRFTARTGPELPAANILSANVPLSRTERRLTLPEEYLPQSGDEPVAMRTWLLPDLRPMRLVERPRSGPVDQPASDGSSSKSKAAPLEPERRQWKAIAWLCGLFAVGGLSRWGSARWKAEGIVGIGLMGVLSAGWMFGAVVAIGLSMRIALIMRSIGQSVGR